MDGGDIAVGVDVIQIALDGDGGNQFVALKNMVIVRVLVVITDFGILKAHVSEIEDDRTGGVVPFLFEDGVVVHTRGIDFEVRFVVRDLKAPDGIGTAPHFNRVEVKRWRSAAGSPPAGCLRYIHRYTQSRGWGNRSTTRH